VKTAIKTTLALALTTIAFSTACSSKSEQQKEATTMGTSIPSAAGATGSASKQEPQRFRSTRQLRDIATRTPSRPVYFAIPTRREGVFVAAVMLTGGNMVLPNYTAEEKEFIRNGIVIPGQIIFVWPGTGKIQEDVYPVRPEHFGLPIPSEQTVGRFTESIVGRYDDLRQPPEASREPLRNRIYDALDVLLPLFADDAAMGPEALKAAQEFRDLFPHACEPGLLPYYKVVGKDFFAWIEEKAPPGKTPLPW